MQFIGFKAELQVRTVVQHAWATIDRSLRYNNEDDIPKEIKRRLFRVSALLEVADKEFSAINETIGELRKSYAEAIRGADATGIAINRESAEEFYIGSRAVAKIFSLAEPLGVELREDLHPERVPTLLVNIAKSLGFTDFASFESLAKSAVEQDQHQLEDFVKVMPTRSVPRLGWLVRVLLVLINDRKLTGKLMDTVRFGERTREILQDLIAKKN